MDVDELREHEYERTFLIRFVPAEIAGTSPVRIDDMYLPADGGVQPRLRLRHRGSHLELTKKVPLPDSCASAHIEATIPLDRVEYQVLASLPCATVSKNRYTTTIGGRVAQVDVFLGALAGLVLIEFEFESRAELTSFQVPDVCLADVTSEDFVAGGWLAGTSYADLRSVLDRHGYSYLEVL